MHTPTPWKLTPFISTYTGAALSWDLIDAEGTTIATIDRPTEKEVGPYLSNALAIAAAPELLEALKDFVNRKTPPHWTDILIIQADFKKLIAKAEGN